MPGVTTATSINGVLDANAKKILTNVMKESVEMSGVSQLLQRVPVPNLVGSIPVASAGSVDEDLDEFEHSDVNGGKFYNLEYNLKKDRVKLMSSDEAEIKSLKGSPLSIQISASAMQLSATLDKKSAEALDTAPQTVSAATLWDTSTNNIYKEISRAKALMKPYKPDAIIMTQDVYDAYISNDTLLTLATGNPTVMQNSEGIMPGTSLNVFVDDNITAKSAILCKSQVCGAIGQGPVKARQWDDGDSGAKVYQYDVFRQAKDCIFKNASNKNMAAVQITGLIS
jgi:hypothetical protein